VKGVIIFAKKLGYIANSNGETGDDYAVGDKFFSTVFCMGMLNICVDASFFVGKLFRYPYSLVI